MDEAAVENLHAVIVDVGHIDVAVTIHCHPPRIVEVGVVRARGACHSQGSHIDAAAVELLDAMVLGVSYIDVTGGVYSHVTRSLEVVIV